MKKNKQVSTEIKLVHTHQNNKWNVYKNGVTHYTPFDDEIKAKAAAFDECCMARAQDERLEYVSYQSF